MVLIWDSHPVESVETPLTCESFAWKYSPAEEMRISYERVSILSFQREHAQRPHASHIYQWLADVQNSRMWLADDLRCTGYPFDKNNDYKRMKQNNDSKCLFL